MLSSNTNLSLELLFALIGAAGVIYGIVKSRKNDQAIDIGKAVETATEFTRLNVKLDVMSQQFTELIRNNEKQIERISQINTEIAEIHSRLSLLFEYKDALEKRIDKIEKKGSDQNVIGERRHENSR